MAMDDTLEVMDTELVAYEDLDESDIDREDGDLYIEQRLELNNESALAEMAQECQLPDDLPWIETMVVTSINPIAIDDVHDDMSRELAFQCQALEAARIGREKAKEAGVALMPADGEVLEMLRSDKARQRKAAVAEAERAKLLKRKRKEEREELMNVDAEDDFSVDMTEQERSQKYAKMPHGGAGVKKTKSKKAIARRPGKTKRQAMRNKA